MKKTITLFFAIIVSLGIFAQQNDTIAMRGCNFDTPGWGKSLGVVSFHTDSMWVIVGNGIRQIWSDAVTATACQKEAFDGGFEHRAFLEFSDFNADCRSNPGFPGDLFSWCVVVRFADVLCPAPWRVPSKQDFIDLDIAMGGTGNDRSRVSQTVTKGYVSRWGGAFGGVSEPWGSLYAQGVLGAYWSLTEGTISGAHCFSFTTIARGRRTISPQAYGLKHFGFSLRCVL